MNYEKLAAEYDRRVIYASGFADTLTGGGHLSTGERSSTVHGDIREESW